MNHPHARAFLERAIARRITAPLLPLMAAALAQQGLAQTSIEERARAADRELRERQLVIDGRPPVIIQLRPALPAPLQHRTPLAEPPRIAPWKPQDEPAPPPAPVLQFTAPPTPGTKGVPK